MVYSRVSQQQGRDVLLGQNQILLGRQIEYYPVWWVANYQTLRTTGKYGAGVTYSYSNLLS